MEFQSIPHRIGIAFKDGRENELRDDQARLNLARKRYHLRRRNVGLRETCPVSSKWRFSRKYVIKERILANLSRFLPKNNLICIFSSKRILKGFSSDH